MIGLLIAITITITDPRWWPQRTRLWGLSKRGIWEEDHFPIPSRSSRSCSSKTETHLNGCATSGGSGSPGFCKGFSSKGNKRAAREGTRFASLSHIAVRRCKKQLSIAFRPHDTLHICLGISERKAQSMTDQAALFGGQTLEHPI